MRIAIDNSPITSSHKLADKIRGTGFYIKNLIDALEKYHPENEYIFFQQGEVPPHADIYHYPYFEPFFFSLPSRKYGKSIVTVHDVIPLVMPKLFPVGVRGKIKFLIQKRRLLKMDGIITDSQASKNDIIRICGIKSEKITSIPLAQSEVYKKIKIHISERKKILNKYHIPDNFVLYVGDATPNKNLKRLINAVLSLKIPLVMVGGALVRSKVAAHPWNKDLLYVQKMAEMYNNIYLLGYVSDADLSLLYNMCKVFAFPSLYEGFGLPVLEAASSGAPIVTSHEGSLIEVIGDSARIVDPYSEESIAAALGEIFNSKTQQVKFGKTAHEKSKKYDWKKTADATTEVYEKIYTKE
ncbi:MAG TPA: glycosyltransferase family 1 protein [Candidatus Levybacteria bacterium]|nr:glycosyltransferase family 1 protein [Candidatus Levybacteria bacterium]